VEESAAVIATFTRSLLRIYACPQHRLLALLLNISGNKSVFFTVSESATDASLLRERRVVVRVEGRPEHLR